MSPGRVANKICLVTGAGSGIGRATAELMAIEGATSIIADIDLKAATSVADSIVDRGFQAEALELDVAADSDWRSAIDKTLGGHGCLDVLINSAGISISKRMTDCSLDEWRKVLAVNLDGVFLGTRHAIKAMRNGGSIVNIASVSGIKPSAGAVAYCASKAAVRMFSKVVAIECADNGSGIRVNTVTPGGVRTPMWEKEDFFRELVDEHGGTREAFAALEGEALSHRFFSPEVVAETILYLASDDASHLTGVEIVLDRGHTG